MNPIYYIAIGIVITIIIIYLFIMAIGSALGGKSPILLRPIQFLLIASWPERIFALIILFLIFAGGHFIYNHVNFNFH